MFCDSSSFVYSASTYRRASRGSRLRGSPVGGCVWDKIDIRLNVLQDSINNSLLDRVGKSHDRRTAREGTCNVRRYLSAFGCHRRIKNRLDKFRYCKRCNRESHSTDNLDRVHILHCCKMKTSRSRCICRPEKSLSECRDTPIFRWSCTKSEEN